MPGTGRGAFNQILKPSFSSIVSPPTDCAHCAGAVKVVVIAKADRRVALAAVNAAGDILKDIDRYLVNTNSKKVVRSTMEMQRVGIKGSGARLQTSKSEVPATHDAVVCQTAAVHASKQGTLKYGQA